MNQWECDVPGCTASAVGVGGAVGLVAIGWSFAAGDYMRGDRGVLRCPHHGPGNGEQEARFYQRVILGMES